MALKVATKEIDWGKLDNDGAGAAIEDWLSTDLSITLADITAFTAAPLTSRTILYTVVYDG